MTRSLASIIRTVAAIAIVAVCGVGCSSGDDAGTATNAPAEASTTTGDAVERDTSEVDPDAFPVTIEHMLGEATIEAPPQRIAALGIADQDIALALGADLVAMVENPHSDDGLFPWSSEGRDLSDVELVPLELLGFDIESLVALAPDLILATSAAGDEAMYRQAVQAGVPVIAPITGPSADSWQERTRAIGAALGRSVAAEQLISDTEAEIERVRTELPELHGKSFSMVLASSTTMIRTISEAHDTVAQLFSALGMVIAPGLSSVENNTIVGAVDLSVERLDLVDADAIFMTGPDDVVESITSNPLFSTLDAVTRGTFFRYDGTTAYGLRVPSPLSIPYVLDQLRPTLKLTASLPSVHG